MAEDDVRERGRNPIISLIYLIFVSPAYLARWVIGLVFKILDWFFKTAEKLLKNDVKDMHEKGGFSGFLAVLIDLVMAAVVWYLVLITFQGSQLLQFLWEFGMSTIQ